MADHDQDPTPPSSQPKPADDALPAALAQEIDKLRDTLFDEYETGSCDAKLRMLKRHGQLLASTGYNMTTLADMYADEALDQLDLLAYGVKGAVTQNVDNPTDENATAAEYRYHHLKIGRAYADQILEDHDMGGRLALMMQLVKKPPSGIARKTMERIGQLDGRHYKKQLTEACAKAIEEFISHPNANDTMERAQIALAIIITLKLLTRVGQTVGARFGGKRRDMGEGSFRHSIIVAGRELEGLLKPEWLERIDRFYIALEKKLKETPNFLFVRTDNVQKSTFAVSEGVRRFGNRLAPQLGDDVVLKLSPQSLRIEGVRALLLKQTPHAQIARHLGIKQMVNFYSPFGGLCDEVDAELSRK
jgi:hypothetical protein